MPVEINENEEKFLNLPLYGDVKINICKENKTIKIVIQHINFVSALSPVIRIKHSSNKRFIAENRI